MAKEAKQQKKKAEDMEDIEEGALAPEETEVRAVAKYVRLSPFKARRAVDLIRGKAAEKAREILEFTPRASARAVLKVLNSAIANAERNEHIAAGRLVVSAVFVDEGPTVKRFRPRARGSAARIRKRTSHITVVVKEREEAQKRGSKG